MYIENGKLQSLFTQVKKEPFALQKLAQIKVFWFAKLFGIFCTS